MKNEEMNDPTEGYEDEELIGDESFGEPEIQENETEAPSDNGAEANEADVLQSKYIDLNDKYLRLYSEFENFRKRTSRERLDTIKTANEGLITQLLPILDDFDRAMENFDGIDVAGPIKEGTEIIYRKFRDVLIKNGLVETEAIGADFDTDHHEAIANVPVEPKQKNKIIDVTQKGYSLNDKVIRYAKVVVGV